MKYPRSHLRRSSASVVLVASLLSVNSHLGQAAVLIRPDRPVAEEVPVSQQHIAQRFLSPQMTSLEQVGEEVVGQARCPFESGQSNVGLFAGEYEVRDQM